MKKGKILIIGITLLTFIFLTGCGSQSVESSTKLNDIEELALNRIIEMLEENSFYNPSKVRVLFGSVFFSELVNNNYAENPEHTKKNVGNYYFKIQGTNSNGGTITQCMQIYPKDTLMTSTGVELDLVRFGDRFKKVEDNLCLEDNLDKDNPKREIMDISKINKALIKHWQDLGIE